MNRTRKDRKLRIILLIVTVLLVIYCDAIAETSDGIGATSGTCGSKATWGYSEGILTIHGTGGIANYTAESGTPWEARKASINAVVVEPGITSIGDYAFYGCDNLTSVSLPDGLRTIGVKALSSCKSLTAIILPSSVTSIGNNCFSSNSKLRNIELSDLLTNIGNGAFSGCTEPVIELKKYKTNQLVAVVANSNSSCVNHIVSFSSSDESVATIDDHAMLTALKDGTATITAMAANGKYATCDVTVLPLNTLNIPTRTTSIENEAFSGLPNIEAVRLPGELTDIALDAFEQTVIVIAPSGKQCCSMGRFSWL